MNMDNPYSAYLAGLTNNQPVPFFNITGEYGPTQGQPAQSTGPAAPAAPVDPEAPHGTQPHFGGGSEGNPVGVLSVNGQPGAVRPQAPAAPAKSQTTAKLLQALFGTNFGIQ